MKTQGFQEARATYTAVTSEASRFRRFGVDGPAYEVIKVASETHAAIRVVSSGEELYYSLDRMRADPIAETIP